MLPALGYHPIENASKYQRLADKQLARARTAKSGCLLPRAQSDLYMRCTLSHVIIIWLRQRELEIGFRRRRNNYSRASSVWMQTANNNACASTEQHHILPILRAERISGDAERCLEMNQRLIVLKRTDERARLALGN